MAGVPKIVSVASVVDVDVDVDVNDSTVFIT